MFDRWNDGVYYSRKLSPMHYDCDIYRNTFLHYLAGVYSDVAGDRSAELGETHDFFLRNGQAILITRLSLRIHRLPVNRETMVWTTWYRKNEGKFFLRDCNVRTEDGELLVSCSGSWAVMDVVEKRALDQREYAGKRALECHDMPDCQECKKIIPPSHMSILGTRPVYYTDLDANNHMTNSTHVRIANDFLPEEFRDRQVKDFFINFNKETKPGETLEVQGGATSQGYVIAVYVDEVLHFSTEFLY